MSKETYIGGDLIMTIGGSNEIYADGFEISSSKEVIFNGRNGIFHGLADNPSNEAYKQDDHYNDYQLFRNGIVKLVKERGKEMDRLISTRGDDILDYSQTFILIKNVNNQTLIKQMSTPQNTFLADFKTMSASNVAAAYTTNVSIAINFYNFINKNTSTGLEFGLSKFIKNKNENNYLIFTTHEIDDNSHGFDFMIKYIGGVENLIAFYHNHDGKTSDPINYGNQWGDENGGDRYTYINTVNQIAKKTYMFPRFFTIHQDFGNVLVEVTENSHKLTGTTFTATGVKIIGKRNYWSK